jgi:tetratricopeptide (TPR) repeat protein
MRFFLSILSILLFTAALAFADLELAPGLESGIQLMNNGQLLEAYTFFKNFTEEYPDNPQGLFLLAMAQWKMMWISSYTKLEREDLEKLINRVEAIFSTRKNQDPNALFFYTAVIGLRASVATWENQWWEAAQLGKVMKNNAEELVKLDPENYDSYYLLGSYNYFADALPGYVKFIRTFLFLPSGNKTEGMKQLILANQKGTITAGEAGRTLSIIYTNFEKQHEYGVKMCDNVLIQYPENYEVGLDKGINLYFLKQWSNSSTWLQHVSEQIQEYSKKHENPDSTVGNGAGIVPVYVPLERETRYWIARNLIQQGQIEEAKSILLKLSDPEIHQPYWLMRGVFLSLAQIDYEEGHPEQAEIRIEKVLQWVDVKDSHEKVKLLKKKKNGIGTFDIDFQ